MHILLRYLGTVAAVYLTISIVSGITVSGGWTTILLVALVWSAISLIVKPILQILALPITILTFGLFALIINALLFMLVAAIVPGFSIAGFIPALFGSIVLSILNWLFHSIFKPRDTT
jgi:putative membrane protein